MLKIQYMSNTERQIGSFPELNVVLGFNYHLAAMKRALEIMIRTSWSDSETGDILLLYSVAVSCRYGLMPIVAKAGVAPCPAATGL